MSDLISREETQKALYGCVMPNQHAEDILAKVPSADIMECARAIKEYCKQHRNEHNFYMCDTCEYASSERAAYAYTYGESHKCPFNVPAYWELPEGSKAE